MELPDVPPAAAVVAVVLGLLGLLVLGWVGLIVAVVVAAAAVLAVGARTTPVVLARAGGRPADHVDYAMLHNVVGGLALAAGVPKPLLLVAPDDAPNALSCGRHPREAAIVVTAGLVQKLTRVELEGVLAHALAHLRSLDIVP